MTAAYIQCRYTRRNDEMCTAEAVSDAPDAPVLLCAKHVAAALELVREHPLGRQLLARELKASA